MAAVVCLPSGPGRWGRPVFPALVSAVVRPGLSVKPARNTCARTPLVSRAHARQREHAPRPVCTPPASTVRLCRPPPPPLFSARRGVRSVARAPLSAPRGRACCVCTRAARTCPVNKSPCGVHCTADREPPVPSLGNVTRLFSVVKLGGAARNHHRSFSLWRCSRNRLGRRGARRRFRLCFSLRVPSSALGAYFSRACAGAWVGAHIW